MNLKKTPKYDDLPDWTSRQKMEAEREVLGFYLTANPLDEYEPELYEYSTHFIDNMPMDQSKVFVAGIVDDLKKKPSSRGQFAKFNLRGRRETVACVCWSDVLQNVSGILTDNAVIFVLADSKIRDRKIELTVQCVAAMDDFPRLEMLSKRCSIEAGERFKVYV